MRKPVIRTEIEAVNVRRAEGGVRVTQGVVDQYTQAITEAQVQAMSDLGLVADETHVESDYGYDISGAARRARRRAG